MGLNPTRRTRTKTVVLVACLVLLGLGATTFLLKGSECPKQTSKWVRLGYPQVDSDDQAIANFASKEQLLVDLEDWAGEFECSGSEQLLGRVLAELTQQNDSLKLSSVVLGAAGKGPKTSGLKAAEKLKTIFSSEAAQGGFSKSVVEKFVTEVKGNSTSFPKALYEIVFRSLPPEAAAEFRSQVRLAELLKLAGSQ
jgi:hypothetical protein